MTALDPAPRRMHRRRASAPHVVMVLAGAAGLVFTLAVLRGGGTTERVAVAARPLEAGSVIRRNDVRFAQLQADGAVRAEFVPAARGGWLPGRVVTVSMRDGEPFLDAHLRTRAAADGRRAMSVPVERARAVNGELAPGDRVDVVVAGDEAVAIAAAGLEVLAVDDPDGGAFGARRGEITVTLAVDARESQLLAQALADGNFVLTRVTGAASASGTPPLLRERAS